MASELEARSSELEARSSELEARSAELTISMELRREVERRAAEELEACRLAAHAAARTRQAEVRSLIAIDCLSHCMHAAGITILCVPSPIPNPYSKPIPSPIPSLLPEAFYRTLKLSKILSLILALVTFGAGFEGA
jgi:hypothetical protein